MSKSTDKMANNVDPHQTAPVGAVSSGSTLFAQTYIFSINILSKLNRKKIARFHQEN